MFKYGMIYQEALRIPMNDLCPLMKTTSSLRLISQIIKMLKDSAPEMIHECPYNESFSSAIRKRFNDSNHNLGPQCSQQNHEYEDFDLRFPDGRLQGCYRQVHQRRNFRHNNNVCELQLVEQRYFWLMLFIMLAIKRYTFSCLLDGKLQFGSGRNTFPLSIISENVFKSIFC